MQAFNPTMPNVARIYDYALGGKTNYLADREAAHEILERSPEAFNIARENRQFLGRAVRLISLTGVTQFIDIGSGLPTVKNTHQIAQGANRDSRVAYVDNDPVVISHANVAVKADPPPC